MKFAKTQGERGIREKCRVERVFTKLSKSTHPHALAIPKETPFSFPAEEDKLNLQCKKQEWFIMVYWARKYVQWYDDEGSSQSQHLL